MEDQVSEERPLSRRALIKAAGAAATGLMLAACGPTPAPQVIRETVVVEKVVEKPVEKVVTKIIAGTPVTVKEVVKETVVVKEVVEKPVTQIVEKVVVKEPTKAPVVLSLMLRAGTEKSEEPIYVMRPKEFTEQTGIQVKLEPLPEYWAKVETLAVAGQLGDNMFTTQDGWMHSRMVHFAYLEACDPYMKAMGIKEDEWLPGAIASCKTAGKIYGLPKCSHPTQAYVWVNHELFEGAGLKIPPTYGTTWEQIREWGNIIAKGPKDKREVYGYYPEVKGLSAIINQIRSFGGWAIDEQGKEALADTQAWKDCCTYHYHLFVTDRIAPTAAELGTAGVIGLFTAKKLAMYQANRGNNVSVREAVGPEVEKGGKGAGAKFNWSAIGLPEGPNFQKWGLSLNTHAGTTQSKHKQESFKLCYALADARFAWIVTNHQGYLVSRAKELEEIGPAAQDPFIKLQYNQHKNGLPYRIGRNYRGGEFGTNLINYLDRLYVGKEKPTDEFFKGLDKALDEILQRPIT